MGLLWLRDLASDATDDPFHKLQVFHGASQWGGYCFAEGDGGKKAAGCLGAQSDVLAGGRGGSQASRLAERAPGPPEVESLSCSTCSLQPGGEGPLAFSCTSFQVPEGRLSCQSSSWASTGLLTIP